MNLQIVELLSEALLQEELQKKHLVLTRMSKQWSMLLITLVWQEKWRSFNQFFVLKGEVVHLGLTVKAMSRMAYCVSEDVINLTFDRIYTHFK